MLNRFKLIIRPILCFLLLFSFQIAAIKKETIEQSSPFKEQWFQRDMPMRLPVEFNHIPKRAGHYTRQDWITVIDSTWGEGLPTADKLEIFDIFWETIDEEYAGFHNLNVDWDSLYTYRDTVVAGVSRGRFYGILSHLSLVLMEMHTWIVDVDIWQDTLELGVPLLVAGGWGEVGHFGAALTPLPDSSLLIYNVVENHPLEPPKIPDLDAVGSLGWTDVEPGDTVTGFILIKNVGDDESFYEEINLSGR